MTRSLFPNARPGDRFHDVMIDGHSWQVVHERLTNAHGMDRTAIESFLNTMLPVDRATRLQFRPTYWDLETFGVPRPPRYYAQVFPGDFLDAMDFFSWSIASIPTQTVIEFRSAGLDVDAVLDRIHRWFAHTGGDGR